MEHPRHIISRAQAKAAGLDRYFTGKSCKHGHVSERYVKGDCIECVSCLGADRELNRKKAKKWRDLNPEKNRARALAYYYDRKALKVVGSIERGLRSASARGAIMDEREALEIFKAQDTAFDYIESLK